MKAEIMDVLSAYSNMRRHLSLAFSLKLKPLKVGQKQASILYNLKMNGSQSMITLSRATLTDPASTTRAIQTMVKKKWVKTAVLPEDQRQTMVALTAEGSLLANQMKALIADAMDHLCEPLTDTDKHTLIRLMNKVGTKG